MGRKWFVVFRDGIQLESADSVRVDSEDAATLRDNIIVKWRNTLADIDAVDLKVHASKAAFDRGEPPLGDDDSIDAFGSEKATALLVVAPSRLTLPPSTDPDVVLYGSYGALGIDDGVDVEDEHNTLLRCAKTRQVIAQLDKDLVLLVKSPPMIGKTSLAALVCRELKSRSLARLKRVVIVSFPMVRTRGSETFFDAFKSVCHVVWEDVLSMADKGYTVYFVVDETQMMYQTNTSSPLKKSSEFWRLIKEILSNKDLGIRVLMFASYGSHIQYVDLGTPAQIPVDQVLGMDLLNFSSDEVHDYVTKCFAGYDSLGDAMHPFCELLVVLTGGHVGFCVTAIRALNEVHRSHKRRCASTPRAEKWLVLQTGELDGKKDKLFNALAATRAVNIFERLGSGGILVRDGQGFDFSSPVLWRYFVKMCIGRVERAVDAPATLDELIIRCVHAMDYDAIRNTLGRSVASRIVLERAWQMVFYLAVQRCTPVAYTTSADVGALFGSPGYLDFTVHREDLVWGVELLRESNKLSEHIGRFAAGGIYSRLGLADYCLLDFRRVRLTGKRARETAMAMPSPSEKLYVVCYNEDLTKIILRRGDSTLTIIESE